MGRKRDDKILKLLKERVLQMDKQLERREYHDATKEALAELTSVPNEEVERIYRQIKSDVEARRKKQRNVLVAITVGLIILALIIIPKIKESLREPVIFIEDFSDNSNSWRFSDTYGTGHYLNDGEFIIDVYKDPNKLEFINHYIELPQNYNVEVDVKKYSGTDDSFGLYLGVNGNNFGYFFIRSNGEFRHGFSVDGKWQNNPDWELHNAVKKGENVINKLEVQVRGNSYQFFINDTKVGEGSMHDLKPLRYSLVAGGTQKIAFDNLQITNANTKEVVFANTFDQEIEPWVNNINPIKTARFEDGNYIITVNNEGYCYWSDFWMPSEFKGMMNYEIRLKARVLKREGNGTLGLMWVHTNSDYFGFEVKDGIQARLVVQKGSDYVYTGNYMSVSEEAGDSIDIQVLLNKEQLEFYSNGVLVDKIKRNHWFYWEDLDRLALRACSNQTIAFQSLELREIK